MFAICFFYPFSMYTFKQTFRYNTKMSTCDALRDLASIVQFKKRQRHPWSSVTFSKLLVS